MKRLVIMIVGILMIPAISGCANGPFRKWVRGSDCDTCNPPAAQPAFFSNSCGPNGCATPPANMGGNPPAGTFNDPYGPIVPPGNQNPGPQ